MNAAALISLIQGVQPTASSPVAPIAGAPAADGSSPEANAFAEVMAAMLAGQGMQAAASPAVPTISAGGDASPISNATPTPLPSGLPGLAIVAPFDATPQTQPGVLSVLAAPLETSGELTDTSAPTAVLAPELFPLSAAEAEAAAAPTAALAAAESTKQPAAPAAHSAAAAKPAKDERRSSTSATVTPAPAASPLAASGKAPAARSELSEPPAHAPHRVPPGLASLPTTASEVARAHAADWSPGRAVDTPPGVLAKAEGHPSPTATATAPATAPATATTTPAAAPSLETPAASQLAPVPAPAAGKMQSETPPGGLFAKVAAQVSAAVAPTPSPMAPAVSPAPLGDEAPPAETPVTVAIRQAGMIADSAPVAAELSAAAASAITAPEPSGRKESAISTKADLSPAAGTSAEPGAVVQAHGEPSQGRTGADSHDAPPSKTETDTVSPAVAELEPEAVFEPSAGEVAPLTSAAVEGRQTPVVRGAPETVANLAAQIARKLDERNTRFEIALDPHGLGAVQVSVEINSRGELSAHMAFERPESAAELRGRSAELQRALEQAGFDLSRGGLSFGEGGERGRAHDENNGRRTQTRAFQDALLTADAADALPARPLRLRDYDRAGLDLRI